MLLLVVVSLIWAFSFGLTKGQLAGIDSRFISAARLGLALLVFLPFLRFRGVNLRTAGLLMTIGAVQFGIMYLALTESYVYLQAHEVVLFTLTTPIFVTLFADALDRTWRSRALLAALVAVVGTAMLQFTSSTALKPTLTGILLVQTSNVAFAIGQVLYRRLRHQQPALRDRAVFGFLYLGAFAIALAAFALPTRDISITLNRAQLLTLLYLGVLSSGVCFFLWNVGATRVSAGTLAVMNNAKVPLGVAVSLLFFREQASVPRLLASAGLLAFAAWLAGTASKDRSAVSPAKA